MIGDATWSRPDLDRLFREHGPGLYRFLVNFSGDGDLAADVVQETFVRFAESSGRIREPRAWLFRVATRMIMEMRRTSARRDRLLTGAPDGSLMGDPGPAPHDLVERAETRALVQGALGVLPDRDRTVLLLREEGFSHREIADAVGTTTGSVGTIIARAMEKLAAELRRNGDALLP